MCMCACVIVCVRECACVCVGCECVWVWVCACVCAKAHNYNYVLIPSSVAVPDSVVNTTNISLSRVPLITSTLRVTIPPSSLTL